MEDDKIKDIFKEFDPELSSSFHFMTRLQNKMEAMEIVRQYNAAQKRRNKLAVAIAGITGFAIGVIMSLLFPLISELISSYNFTMALPHSSAPTFDFSYLVWLLLAAISVLTCISAYKLALIQLSSSPMQSSASQNK